MSQPYIGEIRMFAGNFAPTGWALCNGQILSISENETLYNLIGTTYGGDGQNTFAVPNLCGRIPIHMGTGPGLSTYVIGQAAGTEQVTLLTTQIPSHTHTLNASTGGTLSSDPTNNAPNGLAKLYSKTLTSVGMAPNMIAPTGGSQPHNNMMPYLTVTFIISLYGVFPSQN
jgi:microcystin-dependent protein